MPNCRYCHHAPFSDWHELALHITKEKKGHSRGKTWAAKVLTNVNQLNQKRDLPQRVPLTEEQKEARKESKQDLSGKERMVLTLCPKCNKVTSQVVPEEYAQSKRAWRASNGTLFITCEKCKGR